MNCKLQCLCLVVQDLVKRFHITANGVLHGTNILKDIICRDIFGIDHAANIQPVDDLRISHAVYLRHRFQTAVLLLCKKRQENILLIHICQTYKRLCMRKSFLHQKIPVGSVTIDNRHSGQDLA